MSDRPRLRPEITMKVLTSKDETYAMVKDPVGPTYYRFQIWEYDLLSLLDGEKELEQIAEEFSEKHPEMNISMQWLVDGVDGLRKMGLVERLRQEQHLVMMDKIKTLRKRRLYDAEASTATQILIPLFDPDKLMNKVIPWIKWVWSPWFVAPWLVVFTLVLSFLYQHWDLYWSGFFGLWNLPQKTLGELLGFFFVVFVVSVWHELGHGLTCKRYGGEVHSIGFMLLYFQPAFYCRIDDAYMFPRPAYRIYSTFGGAYFELMLCSMACATWMLTPAEWWIHSVALTVVFFTGLSVVLLNVNPLIRLDGYYVLMELLEVPDLRENSFEYLGNLFKKHVLRLEVPHKPIPRRRRRIYLIYGVCSMLYTALLFTFLFKFLRRWLLTSMGPAGYLPLAGIVVFAMRRRIRKAGGFVRHFWLDKRDLLRKWRYAALAGGALLLVIGLLTVPGSPTRIEAQFTAAPSERFVVRAPAEGVVRSVLVREGEAVHKGQLLAELDNVEMETLPQLARSAAAEHAIQAARARESGDMAVSSEQAGAAAAAEAQLALLRGRVRMLSLRSPIDGVVSTARLQDMLGRHLGEGGAFCSVDRLQRIALTVSTSERDIEEIHEGTRVRLLATAYPTHPRTGTVLSVAPIATPPTDENALDLIHRANLVPVRVELENAGGFLKEGMTGRIQFLTRSRSLAGKFFWRLRRWSNSVFW